MRLRALVFVLIAGVGVGAAALRLGDAAAAYVEHGAHAEVAAGLAASGEDWAAAEADGLIVTLTGAAPDEARRLRAVEIVRQIVDPNRVRDATTLAAAAPIDPPGFALELMRNEGEVSLIGLAPEEAGQDEIARALASAGLDVAVSDMLESVAHPPPPGWEPALRFGLAALGSLPRAKISVTPGRVEVTALAESDDERETIEADLRARLPDGVRLASRITAPRPVIAPFRLDFTLDADGSRFAACTAETEADAAAIAGAERTALIPITQGRASDISETVNTLYVQKEIARRGQRAVSVLPNVQLNALVVSGTEADVNAVRGIVERIESAEVTAVQEVKRIELRTANALEVVNLLENVLAGRSLGGARGIGASQATRLRYLRDQIASEIQGATGAQPTEAAIDGAIREQVRLTPDLRTNSVMVAAPPAMMEIINAIVGDLDATSAGSRKVEWFRLKNADARAMAQVLQDLFSLRQDGDRLVLVPTQREPDAGAAPGEPSFSSTTLTPIPDSRKELSITIDARTNTLLVSGTQEYLDLVRSVVDELDGIEATERMQLVYKLRYAKADEVERTLARYFQEESTKVRSTLGPEQSGSLSRQLEQEVTVVGDGKSNKLVVSTSPRYAEIVKSIIEELDAAPPQVMIQVLLAEVTLDASKQWGMDFNAGPFGGNMWKFGSLGAGAGVATALGVANLSISTNDFNVLIRALEVQGKLEVLSRPQVAVNNNEKALIQVGEDIAIVTGVERLDNGNTRSDVERRDVGIILNVTPSISSDGFVRLEISPEISSVSTRTTQISEDFEAPIITTRKVDTVVTVKDGQTIVIGGLIQNTLEDRRTKVPLLGDIPLVGNAFKSKQVENIKTELLVILTPKVVPGDSPSAVELQNRWTQHEIGRLSSPGIIRDALEMHDGTPPPEVLDPADPGLLDPAPRERSRDQDPEASRFKSMGERGESPR